MAGEPGGGDVSGRDEYVADTEPSDAGSYFHFAAILAGNETLVTYTSTNTRYYVVNYAADPTDGSGWAGLFPVSMPGSNGASTASDPVGPRTRIYRARVPAACAAGPAPRDNLKESAS